MQLDQLNRCLQSEGRRLYLRSCEMREKILLLVHLFGIGKETESEGPASVQSESVLCLQNKNDQKPVRERESPLAHSKPYEKKKQRLF